LTLRCCSYFF